MESPGMYLLKSAVWLTGFTFVFLMVLRNERYFRLNRIYLLSGIIASMVFPFYTLHYPVILSSGQGEGYAIPGLLEATAVTTPRVPVFFWIYLVGIICFASRLVWQTGLVVRKLRKTGYEANGPVKLVRTSEYASSFSFFSYVFVNPSTSDIETKEIVNHEREHIQQRHWFDLLLVELLCMLQWFNPVAWIYSRLVRQNHEYLADESALQRTSDPAIYRATLLNQMFGGPVISLANSFSYSLNKKRFKMMKKRIDSPFRKLKLLMVLPIMALVFYAFAEPEYISLTNVVQSDKTSRIEKGNVEKDKVVKGKVVKPDGNPLWGTSVILKGTTIGTITDKRGNFRLKDVPQDGELVFSFVGYKSLKMKPDFSKAMIINMVTSTIGIDEVVVVGYGDFKSFKNSKNPPLYIIAGSILPESVFKAINPEKIESVNVLKSEPAIAKYGEQGANGAVEVTLKKGAASVGEKDVTVIGRGKMSDLKIQPSPSGYRVRTIDSENPPLILLDGVIIDKAKMDAINTENIGSITVSKDKSATALYGEKGKNGVIVITSKKNFSGLESKNSTANLSRIESFDPKHPPLYVVDGVITDTRRAQYFLEIGVESVNVLKGKSATDKYGEKGSYGVVEMVLRENSATARKSDKKDVTGSDNDQKKDKEVFVVVEEMPEFPGGELALRKFIAQSVKYPAEAKSENAQGKVFVTFIVTSTGKVENAKIARAVHPALDAEAIRVVSTLPDWKPGKQRGKAVDVSYTIPIQFALQADGNKSANAKTSENVNDQKKGKEVFIVVEEMPEFPGGKEALMKFIAENVKYPDQAKVEKVQGKVFVNFVVSSTGKVENRKVVRSVNPALDSEALRVISLMPDWKPGKQRGLAVDVAYTIPIQFTLQ